MKDSEIFVGGWYLIGDNPFGHSGELAYVTGYSLAEPVVNMRNKKNFDCRKCDLRPIIIQPEYLLENGWEYIDDDEDGSKCYGIDLEGTEYYLDWWTPSEDIPKGLLCLGWEKAYEPPYEMEVNELHKLQQMLLFWGYDKPFVISNFLPQFKPIENEAKKDVNKKKHKHKH